MNPATIAFGLITGLSLGLTGGGGAIFAVPLLVYGNSMAARQATIVSILSVGATAFVGFLLRLRNRQVEIKPGIAFASTGMITAPIGDWIGDQLPDSLVMTLFGLLMLVVSFRMWKSARKPADSFIQIETGDGAGPSCPYDPEGRLRVTSRCARLLGLTGMAVGLLTGLFGIGGGFVIVPALVLLAHMDVKNAVGTSLLVITLVSVSAVVGVVIEGDEIPAATSISFLAGSLSGMGIGTILARRIGGPRLQQGFAAAILAVACWVIMKNILAI
jgi:uncharacterized membrane protein YfcA